MRLKQRVKPTTTTTNVRLQSWLADLILLIVTMGLSLDQPVTEDPKTIGGILSASLPQALGAGMFAIGVLLVNMQIQSARIEATVQSTAQAVEELKNDAKSQLAQLDDRVRALEMNK